MTQKRKNQGLMDIVQMLVLGAVFMGLFFAFMKWYDAEDGTITSIKTNTVQEDIDNYKRNRYGEPTEVKCSWCGGVGRVGFSGESETQYRKTGKGLGNYCISCRGTGKIKKYNEQ